MRSCGEGGSLPHPPSGAADLTSGQPRRSISPLSNPDGAGAALRPLGSAAAAEGVDEESPLDAPCPPEAADNQSAAAAEGADEEPTPDVADAPRPPGAADDDDEAEEARPPPPNRGPRDPTRAEIEAHQATHLPFRSWCKHCVAGRSDNPPHRRAPPRTRRNRRFRRSIWITPS